MTATLFHSSSRARHSSRRRIRGPTIPDRMRPIGAEVAVSRPGFHPDLETAIAELATEEVRWNRLALRFGDGDHDALEQLYGEALGQLPHAVLTEFRRRTRHLDANHLRDARHLEGGRGLQAAARTVGARRTAARAGRSDRGAALADLATLPRDRAPRAVLDYVDEVASRTSSDFSVRLWYPSVAFLCFAALNAKGTVALPAAGGPTTRMAASAARLSSRRCSNSSSTPRIRSS